MEKVQNLGIVSPIPKGEWSAETTYYYLNIVRWNKASYMAKKNNVNIEPEKHNQWNEYWSVLNKDGLDGADLYLGETSDTAYAGDKGKANANAIYNIQEEQIEQNKNIATNRQNISLLMSISEQNNLFHKATVEDAFISRQTANGLTVVDPSPAVVQTIKGKTVKSTNLIPFPYSFSDTTAYGIKVKTNDDCSITFTGTEKVDFYIKITQFKVGELPIGTYYCSGGNDDVILLVDGYIDGKLVKNLCYGNKNFTVDFNGYDMVAIFVYIKKDTAVNYTIYPMLNEGSTALPFRPYFSGLKNAYLQSIKSTGRNLVDGSRDEVTVYGVTCSAKSPYIYINGSSKAHNRIWLTSNMTLPAGTYTVCMKRISGNWSPMIEAYNSILLYLYKAIGTTVKWNIIAEIPFASITIQKSATFTLTEETTFVLSSYLRGETYNKMVFAFQIVSGETENYDFEPYVEDTFNLPETLELGEWDSYNPQTGYVSRNTEYATSETGFTKDQLSGLSVAILSADRKTVAYKKLSFNGEQYTKRDTHYTAWNGGSETVEQGETDNSRWGAIATTGIQYYVLGGITSES